MTRNSKALQYTKLQNPNILVVLS